MANIWANILHTAYNASKLCTCTKANVSLFLDFLNSCSHVRQFVSQNFNLVNNGEIEPVDATEAAIPFLYTYTIHRTRLRRQALQLAASVSPPDYRGSDRGSTVCLTGSVRLIALARSSKLKYVRNVSAKPVKPV